MKQPGTYTALEDLGRTRLSRHFFMRNFMNSEIANFYARSNIPDDPDLAIEAGRRLCALVLDPLVETFGPIEIRSGFRSCDLNSFGATQVKPQKCSRNEANFGGHIWDRRDADGHIGATVSVLIPWFADQFDNGRDWRDLAWWVYDHLPHAEVYFFPRKAAFNIQWHETAPKRILSYIQPKGALLKAGAEPSEGLAERQQRYADFPPFRAITYPPLPERWRT